MIPITKTPIPIYISNFSASVGTPYANQKSHRAHSGGLDGVNLARHQSLLER